MLVRSKGTALFPISKVFLIPSGSDEIWEYVIGIKVLKLETGSAETWFWKKKIAELRNNIPTNPIVNGVFKDFNQMNILTGLNRIFT